MFFRIDLFTRTVYTFICCIYSTVYIRVCLYIYINISCMYLECLRIIATSHGCHQDFAKRSLSFLTRFSRKGSTSFSLKGGGEEEDSDSMVCRVPFVTRHRFGVLEAPGFQPMLRQLSYEKG